nr:hypothetical protein CFP56_38090 [Quercus suber]
MTTPLVAYDEREITYLAATNVRWLPYLADEGLREELLGGREFSLVPPEGLHAIISSNPQLLLPTKSVIANARKQNMSTIFKWKGFASKSAKKGTDASEVYSNIVPYNGGLPPIGNIVLKSTTPRSARVHSTRRSATAQSRPPLSR